MVSYSASVSFIAPFTTDRPTARYTVMRCRLAPTVDSAFKRSQRLESINPARSFAIRHYCS